MLLDWSAVVERNPNAFTFQFSTSSTGPLKQEHTPVSLGVLSRSETGSQLRLAPVLQFTNPQMGLAPIKS